MFWAFWKRWARRSSDDVAAEIEAHIAMEAERLVRAGMSPEDVLSVYEQKWKVNHARLDRGAYGRATKDPADAECRAIAT